MTRISDLSAYAMIPVLILFLGCVQSSEEQISTMNDLESAVSGLLASPADDAFLIVTIAGSPDFVQISGYRGSAELDFPQITDRQKQLRPRIETVCQNLGLGLRVTRGSNGMEFLDYDLPSDAKKIVAILRRIFSDVFEVTEATELEFRTNGFDLPAA